MTVACVLTAMPRIVSSGGQKSPLGVYAVMAIVGIVLPGANLLFYRSPGVREACEWLDPEKRWTDRVPVIVLAAAMLLVAGAGLALGLGFSAPRQRMFFGDVLEPRYRLAFLGAALLQLLLGVGARAPAAVGLGGCGRGRRDPNRRRRVDRSGSHDRPDRKSRFFGSKVSVCATARSSKPGVRCTFLSRSWRGSSRSA